MRDARQPDDGARLGALILAGALLFALIVVGLRLATRGPAPPPAAPPVATAVPTLAPLATPPPATPAPLPATPVAQAPAQVAGRPIVCLDPGHGGVDLGNVRVEDGTIVLREKDFTLEHGLALAERLRARGFEVVMTRTTDSEVNPTNADVNGDGEVASPDGEARTDQLDDLQARVNVCNAAGANLLVSMHYNGAENVNLSGYEVWYNDERPFSDRSQRFAAIMHEELGNGFAAAGYDAFDKGVGIEEFVVIAPARPGELVPSEMPGAVVEGLFLSNADDAAFIVSDAADQALLGAYENAIVRYFAEYPV